MTHSFPKTILRRVVATLALTPFLFAASSAGAQEDDGGFLEEIVVTATKREMSVQDVSIAITAVSGVSLRDNGIVDITRLEVLVPGLQFGQSGSDARPAIRGTRTENVINNADPTIAFFVDEVYRSRPGQALASFVDAERVEVLRGPQGTLFGRNSFGGTVHVINEKPDFDAMSGNILTTFTNYNGVRAEGFWNIPVSDNVALRLSGMGDVRDGYVENTFDTSNNLKDNRDWLVRGQLAFGNGTNFDGNISIEKFEGGGNGDGDFGYRTIGVAIEPGTGLVSTSGVIEPRAGQDPTGASGGGRADSNYFPADPGPYTIARYHDMTMDLEQTTASVNLNWEFSDFATLTAILSYADYYEQRTDDGNFATWPGNIFGNTVTAETTTQEIRLTSIGDDRFEWVIGTYFLQDESSDRFLFAGANVPVPDDPISDPVLTETPEFGCCDTRVDEIDAMAVYADGSFSLTDTFRLVGGIRYTEEDRSLDVTNGVTGADKWDFVTWRAGLEFDATDSSMLYLMGSTGYLSGGFNSINNPIVPQTFDEQEITALEVGWKNSLLGGNMILNVFVYYNDITELLAQGFVADPAAGGNLLSYNFNGGEVEAKGIEVEVDYAPNENLRLSAGLSYNKSEFGDFVVVAQGSFETGGDFVHPVSENQAFQLDGRQVTLNPETTFSLSADYTFYLDEHGTITPALTFYASSDYLTTDQPYSFSAQDSYTRTDLRLTWQSADDRFMVQGFINNVEDEAVLTRTVVFGGALAIGDYAAPTIYGIRAGMSF
jgi:iron complex outermembrane receptor protein